MLSCSRKYLNLRIDIMVALYIFVRIAEFKLLYFPERDLKSEMTMLVLNVKMLIRWNTPFWNAPLALSSIKKYYLGSMHWKIHK